MSRKMRTRLINRTFGRHLAKARKEAGISQEELAFCSCLHRTYISLLERGLRSPTLPALFRICEVMGLSPGAFVAQVDAEVRERERSSRNGNQK